MMFLSERMCSHPVDNINTGRCCSQASSQLSDFFFFYMMVTHATATLTAQMEEFLLLG